MSFIVALALICSMTLVLIGVPIAASFGLGAFASSYLSGISIDATFSTVFSRLNSPSLLALPLFIYMGILVDKSGQGERIVDFVSVLVGRLRGGLGVITVFACAVFGAVSGAGSAAIASIGSVLIPRAVAAGYPREYLVALVACSSILTLLVPPSIPLLILALTMQISIAGAFLTTLVPGLVIAVGYAALNIKFAQKFPLVDSSAAERDSESFGQRFFTTGGRAVWILLMPLVVLGSIYGGFASPTEAAGIGAVYVAFLGLVVYRSLNAREFLRATVESGQLVGTLICMITALILFSTMLVYQGTPFVLAELVSDKLAVWQGLLVINVILLIIGMIMDDISGSIVAASVLYPVANELGIDPLQFAAIVGVNLGLGNVTPPVAPLLFLTSAVAGNVPMHMYFGYLIKFIVFVNLPVLILVTYIPQFSLFLPHLLGY